MVVEDVSKVIYVSHPCETLLIAYYDSSFLRRKSGEEHGDKMDKNLRVLTVTSTQSKNKKRLATGAGKSGRNTCQKCRP
jgi:hypothetical protein